MIVHPRTPATALLILVGLLLLVPAVAGSSAQPGAHYLPQPGNRFSYYETIFLTDGTGNYSGYSEASYYNGSIAMTSLAPNGTVNATYQSSGTYTNSDGADQPWSETGWFWFSSDSFLYTRGTDNQTGYVNPTVWFYIDNTLTAGSPVTLLNTGMSVVTRSYAYPTPLTSTGYAATIFTEGNGTYTRDDSYGTFSAAYNWKAYFDPSTGYIVGYQYTETDTSGSGDGFTWTDTVTDTSTTFSLTAAAGPATSSSPSGYPVLYTVLILLAVLIVIVLIVVLLRRRSRGRLPRHPTTQIPGQLPTYAPPPPVGLVPSDQPRIQQVVVRETVKVPCRYCGTLMDSTATNCPNCGAPRT